MKTAFLISFTFAASLTVAPCAAGDINKLLNESPNSVGDFGGAGSFLFRTSESSPVDKYRRDPFGGPINDSEPISAGKDGQGSVLNLHQADGNSKWILVRPSRKFDGPALTGADEIRRRLGSYPNRLNRRPVLPTLFENLRESRNEFDLRAWCSQADEFSSSPLHLKFPGRLGEQYKMTQQLQGGMPDVPLPPGDFGDSRVNIKKILIEHGGGRYIEYR